MIVIGIKHNLEKLFQFLFFKVLAYTYSNTASIFNDRVLSFCGDSIQGQTMLHSVQANWENCKEITTVVL